MCVCVLLDVGLHEEYMFGVCAGHSLEKGCGDSEAQGRSPPSSQGLSEPIL